jgi:hypothetical protein
MHKCFVEVRIVKPGARASMFTSAQQPGFAPDGEDFVFQSRLEPDASVSEHLKWLYGILEFERKRLAKLQADGVEMVCRIRVRGRTLTIEPEALLLMHQLHLRTEVSFNP